MRHLPLSGNWVKSGGVCGAMESRFGMKILLLEPLQTFLPSPEITTDFLEYVVNA